MAENRKVAPDGDKEEKGLHLEYNKYLYGG